MTVDLFDDDDLFAPRPTAKQPEAMPLALCGKSAPGFCVSSFIGPRWPIASFECRCGAREEVREPCPDALDCWQCRGLETMRRYAPRYLPPLSAGRPLTAIERRGFELDVGHP